MTNTLKAKAKINLFLHVTSRTENNYHNLESIVAFANDIYDIISIKSSNSLYLTMDGPFSSSLSATDNLILKAAFCLQNYTNTSYGAHIHLTKNIPVAAGLGGGSSDAAAVLKLLNNFWKLDITDFTLYNICAKLGSDIPICYYGKYSYFSGKGEIITPIETTCPKIYALLINPLIATSTQAVFYNLREEEFSKPFSNRPQSFLHLLELIEFLKIQKNDLEKSAIRLVPEINDIINVLNSQNGCILSRMSGSGATCFGLFTSLEEAKHALTTIQKHHGNWWSDVTLLT
ncbi:4-diphosphocytidyl-2-C-methyl-D-erythritol kinase [Rickettsiales bacterium Ac37b]|nr:4-diphosphocytidyl-2-C-methyl-D-erythritol kinase [Rickettsiales bacterium Ac37b]